MNAWAESSVFLAFDSILNKESDAQEQMRGHKKKKSKSLRNLSSKSRVEKGCVACKYTHTRRFKLLEPGRAASEQCLYSLCWFPAS